MKNLLMMVFILPIICPCNCQSLEDEISSVFGTSTAAPTSSSTPDSSDENLKCNGTCVPYYLCKSSITDGLDLIDLKAGTMCEDYFDICCNPNDVIQTSTTPPSNRKDIRCGIRNVDGVGFRITGDVEIEAQYGEFPWMVAVLRKESIDGIDGLFNVYQCGGALIHPKVVLTSAHCVNKLSPEELTIRAGEWDTATQFELYPHQDRKVVEIRAHPYFHPGAQYYNSALLFLESPVEFEPNTGIICLPETDDNFDHAKCFVSGWGRDVFGKEGKYQVILKRVDVSVVPEKICENSLRKTRLGPTFELHETFICAGGKNGRDTCKGDGGSPLVCPMKDDPTRYKQAGIVSWGIDCGTSNSPGVFVNVAEVREWIDDEMSYHDLDSSFYQANASLETIYSIKETSKF